MSEGAGPAEIVMELVRAELWRLDRDIREADALSEPCPEGRWRWADVKNGGYGKKTEPELQRDRERQRTRAVRLRARQAALADWAEEQEADAQEAGPADGMSVPVPGACELPEGWDIVELSVSCARVALASWDSGTGKAPCLDRASLLAECTRVLIAQLDADRVRRSAARELR